MSCEYLSENYLHWEFGMCARNQRKKKGKKKFRAPITLLGKPKHGALLYLSYDVNNR